MNKMVLRTTLWSLSCLKSLSALLFLAPALAWATPQQERMLTNLDIVKTAFEVKYAPIEWKKSFLGWDLDEQIDKAKAEVVAAADFSLKNYQRIVRDFFLGLHDYHTNVQFYSTEEASLPFYVKGAQGRYFITFVDRRLLPFQLYNLQPGDELIEFDGKPVADVIAYLIDNETGRVNSGTDDSIAEFFLTHRFGVLAHNVPTGAIAITVRASKTGKVSTYKLSWNYIAEKVGELPIAKSCKDTDLAPLTLPLCNHPCLRKVMATPLYPYLKSCSGSDASTIAAPGDPHSLGCKHSFLPLMGTKLWEAGVEVPFHAYLFETSDKKRIGYIRIAEYHGDEKSVEQFGRIINFFQSKSDALIVDQQNNPGGSVFYLFALLSMLTDRPLELPVHCFTLTPHEVMFSVLAEPIFEQIKDDATAKIVLGDTIDGYPATYQLACSLLHNFRFIIDQWNRGKTLSDSCHPYGMEKLLPHPQYRYNKPIFLLANGMSFSCGDLLAAILQDNKRAMLLGSTTAGAGGILTTFSFANHFGINSINLTGSVIERSNGQFIENSGVAPDIFLELTPNDLQGNYCDYVSAIHDALTGKADRKAAAH